MADAEVEIWDDDILAGHARLHPTGKGKEAGIAVEFDYDRAFLASPRARQIDPEFDLYEGTHVVDDPRANLQSVWAATAEWRDVARAHGLSRAAIDAMSTAFEPLRSATTSV